MTELPTNNQLIFNMSGERLVEYAIQDVITIELAAKIAELESDLQFVERWANHHARKPSVTAQEALSMIQHYPSIRAITKGYADGGVPDTFNPYEKIAEQRIIMQHALAALESFGDIEVIATEEQYAAHNTVIIELKKELEK